MSLHDLDINGATLHVEVHGDGEPLLWLHGFMGAGPDWRYVFDQPPAGYRLIAPDMRGHGASTNPSPEFSFRQTAVDTLALLSKLHIDRVKAIGLSGGGSTLLHMATLRPDAVTAMVLVSTPSYYPEQARAIQRQFSPSMLSEAELTLMRARHHAGDRQLDRLFAHAREFAADRDDVNFDAATLARVTARSLIVYGDRDPLYPVSSGVELFERMPQSALWVIPNGGHGPIFGPHAEAFRRVALDFLRD